MKPRFFALCALCLFALASTNAQETPQATYQSILAQVKNSDSKADFGKLRTAFTQTGNYKPYDSDRNTKKSLFAALQKKEYAKAKELAGKILETNYVDVDAHRAMYRACSELQMTDQAKFHRYVLDGLIQSILKSGDGKTAGTAYVVIATNEEYAALSELGIKPTRQALVSDNGKRYDRFDGVNQKNNEQVTVYFNIDRQFSWLKDQLEKGESKKAK
jgi:hypothetical protein